MQALRIWSEKIGSAASLGGLAVLVIGLAVGSLATFGVGSVLFCGGLYALIFAHIGSF